MVDPLRPGQQPAGSGLLGELQSEVAVEATPLLSFVLGNIRAIVGAVLALVLVIVGYGVWQWRVSTSEREANMALGRVLIGTSGAEQVNALEALVEKAPSQMRRAVLLALASSAVNADEPGKAADAYARVYGDDPQGVLGLMSGLNEADLLQRQGKLKESLAVLEKLEPVAPDMLQTLVREELAAVAEQAGQYDAALRAYETLANTVGQAQGLGMDTGFYRERIKEIKSRMSAKG